MKKTMVLLAILALLLAGCGKSMDVSINEENLKANPAGYVNISGKYSGPNEATLTIDGQEKKTLNDGDSFSEDVQLKKPEDKTITVTITKGSKKWEKSLAVDNSLFKEFKEEINREPETKEPPAASEEPKKDSGATTDELAEKYKEKIALLAHSQIGSLEQKEIESTTSDPSKAAVYTYMSIPVRDKAGNEFKYCFLIENSFTIKGSTDVMKYKMAIGYKEEAGLETDDAYLLQYVSDTGTKINAMDPSFNTLHEEFGEETTEKGN